MSNSSIQKSPFARELPMSSEEREAQLMEYYRKHPFRAKKVMRRSRSMEKPRPRPVTTPEPFRLSVSPSRKKEAAQSDDGKHHRRSRSMEKPQRRNNLPPNNKSMNPTRRFAPLKPRQTDALDERPAPSQPITAVYEGRFARLSSLHKDSPPKKKNLAGSPTNSPPRTRRGGANTNSTTWTTNLGRSPSLSPTRVAPLTRRTGANARGAAKKTAAQPSRETASSPPPPRPNYDALQPFHLLSTQRHEAYQKKRQLQLQAEEEERQLRTIFVARPFRAKSHQATTNNDTPTETTESTTELQKEEEGIIKEAPRVVSPSGKHTTCSSTEKASPVPTDSIVPPPACIDQRPLMLRPKATTSSAEPEQETMDSTAIVTAVNSGAPRDTDNSPDVLLLLSRKKTIKTSTAANGAATVPRTEKVFSFSAAEKCHADCDIVTPEKDKLVEETANIGEMVDIGMCSIASTKSNFADNGQALEALQKNDEQLTPTCSSPVKLVTNTPPTSEESSDDVPLRTTADSDDSDSLEKMAQTGDSSHLVTPESRRREEKLFIVSSPLRSKPDAIQSDKPREDVIECSKEPTAVGKVDTNENRNSQVNDRRWGAFSDATESDNDEREQALDGTYCRTMQHCSLTLALTGLASSLFFDTHDHTLKTIAFSLMPLTMVNLRKPFGGLLLKDFQLWIVASVYFVTIAIESRRAAQMALPALSLLGVLAVPKFWDIRSEAPTKVHVPVLCALALFLAPFAQLFLRDPYLAAVSATSHDLEALASQLREEGSSLHILRGGCVWAPLADSLNIQNTNIWELGCSKECKMNTEVPCDALYFHRDPVGFVENSYPALCNEKSIWGRRKCLVSSRSFPSPDLLLTTSEYSWQIEPQLKALGLYEVSRHLYPPRFEQLETELANSYQSYFVLFAKQEPDK